MRKKFFLKKLVSKKARQKAVTQKAAKRLGKDLARDRERLERAKRRKQNGR
jgi:hypothetical protein